MMNFLRKQMKWVMAIIVVAFLLSTFLMYEGRGTRGRPRINPDGSMSDYEVAQINGRSLMRSELERRLRDYLSNYSSRSAESLDMPAIYQAVLDQAILESQLAKEVEEKGIRVSDADADRAMKEYADRYYPTRETFYQALANSGVKIDDYKRSLARQMATEQVIRDAIGEVVISEDRATEFYETMKTLIYSRPEGYMLHMADFNSSADAEYLKAKLDAGETWADIVSNDELASHDVINITREPVFLPSTAFSAGTLSVLASVDVGKASPVFSVSSFDYAVGLKTEHVDASVRPYEEVSGDIKTMLTNQEERRRLTEYETSLRNKAQVVINDQELFARPAVSEDEAPAVEDVIPELATESEEPSIETPAVVEETKQESEPETPAEATQPETETPAVIEEAKPATETENQAEEAKPATETENQAEEAKPATETETPAEEAQPETETPAEATQPATETPTPTEATQPATETETPAEATKPEPETPTPAEATQHEAETPTPAEETQPETETPTPAEETQHEAETPTPAEATQHEAETPTPAETPAIIESGAQSAEVIASSEDIPIQETVE
ncbi:MAG: SurA N-terminal domain-containing protein [Synergistaceae bacterium]|nr:SurA N-terminal domain-containing protein [Synergistaceae bacterium]